MNFFHHGWVFAASLACGVLDLAGQSAAPPITNSTAASFPYSVNVWKTEQGLPHNTVEAIVQTRDGYLWLATPAGLARFDGLTFTVFNRRNTPEMASDECRALAEDTEGNLWIGTYRGLLRYRDGVFTRFTTQDGLLEEEVRLLQASRKAGIYVGGGNNFCRVVGSQF